MVWYLVLSVVDKAAYALQICLDYKNVFIVFLLVILCVVGFCDRQSAVRFQHVIKECRVKEWEWRVITRGKEEAACWRQKRVTRQIAIADERIKYLSNLVFICWIFTSIQTSCSVHCVITGSRALFWWSTAAKFLSYLPLSLVQKAWWFFAHYFFNACE